MSFVDLHTHTTFSDGKNTPEEMVQKAISLGVTDIGFSDHSYTFFDEIYCMKKGMEETYRRTIEDLKRKYCKEINIYCGIEQDFYAEPVDLDSYDYVIGSVHYVKVGEDYITVDESPECFQKSVEKYFNGDAIAFAEKYFETVALVLEKTDADIIGHFDLISKFNREGIFDESDPRYVKAWQAAADKLLTYDKPFEINTGAISRGYKDMPYPSPEMISYIKAYGGTFILSSDAHSVDGLCYQFEKWNILEK